MEIDDGLISIWDISGANVEQTKLHTLDSHGGDVLDVRFSPDGKLIASANVDGTSRVWNVQPGETPLIRRAHNGQAVKALSRSGRFIITGGGG